MNDGATNVPSHVLEPWTEQKMYRIVWAADRISLVLGRKGEGERPRLRSLNSHWADDGRKGLGRIREDSNSLSLGNWDWKGIAIGWAGFNVEMSPELKKICNIWDGRELSKRKFLGGCWKYRTEAEEKEAVPTYVHMWVIHKETMVEIISVYDLFHRRKYL